MPWAETTKRGSALNVRFGVNGIQKASKAGVVKVFDNRETATPENKRPQFVSADGNKVPFWAPKNPTTEDIGLKFGG